MTNYLGIDVGGTKIAAGLVTDIGQVIQRRQCPTPAREGGQAVLAAMLDMAREITASGEEIAAIGIGTGGQVDAKNGIIVSATDLLPGWAGTQIRKAFEETFARPTSVDNDVNALAVGEARFGAGQGLECIAFLALGTGVGGALLLHGNLHHGAHWTGGEFGHILLTMDPHARRDGGGSIGTLEAYASGSGLVQTWRDLTDERDQPMTGEEIAADAVRDPEGIAAQAIMRTGEYLGFGLVSLANALDPDAIVIGGGLASLGDLLLDPARRVLQAHALPGPRQCPIMGAQLGSDASLVGAAALAMPFRA